MRLLACLLLVGCAATAPSDPYDIDLSSGAADSTGIDVHEVSAGDHLALSVDTGDMLALRMLATGAVIVHRTSGDLDPFAIVKDASKTTLAQSMDQRVAPALDARDSIVIAPSGSFVLVSGEDLESGGDFTVVVVALPAPRTMSLEGTIARVTGDALRDLEPVRAGAIANGYIIERADGGLDENLPNIPLAERAAVSRLVFSLEESRHALADGLAMDAPDDALANLAAIWAAL
jgi:hypothetical protein